MLHEFTGTWTGVSQTWFSPGEPDDESEVRGVITPILGDAIVRHVYEGSMQGKPRRGEETLAFNPLAGKFQVSWFDDFHMSQGIMFSEGKETGDGFSVVGFYDVGPGLDPWSWQTDYALDGDNLTITAWNIAPDGTKDLAVRTTCKRQP